MAIKKRKTREQRIDEIMAAATKIFVSKGYSKATMEDIIAETELSKGGFYHYYTSTKDILIDMMARGNMQYMRYNEKMQALHADMDLNEKTELILDAFIDKSLYVTDEKKIYAMFLFEAMYDQDFWKAYLEYEQAFVTYIFNKIGITEPENLDDCHTMTRMLNSLLMGQQTSREPELLQGKRDELKTLFRPMVLRLIS